MNKEIEERVKAYIISCISPRNYLETLPQKLVRTNNNTDEMYAIKKVNIDKCINVISDEWLKKFCFEIFHDDRYNRRGVQMTIKELEKKLTELNDMRLELREQIKEMKLATAEAESPKPPHPRWKPEQGIYYYCIEANSISPVSFYYYDADRATVHKTNIEIGNVFHTKAEAEFAAERLKVLTEMREWAGNWNDEFSLRYEENSGIETYLHLFPCKTYGEMRFATKEDALNCINAVGEDRIKKYYFMIPEEANND